MKTASDIVITGMAAISPAGVGLEPLAAALAEKRSCLAPIPEEIAGPGHLWGVADQFKAADFMPPLKARKFDRCSMMAVVAAGMALANAGVDMKALAAERVGIVLGCGFGGIANSAGFLTGYFDKGIDGLAPMLFPNTVANAAASNASIEHGMKGPNVTIVQRFCSAETAFDIACRYLDEGRADVMVTGGVDELTPLMIKAFHAMGQLNGYADAISEGCGLLVLERKIDAARRGAVVRGRVENVGAVGLVLPGFEDEAVDRLVPDRAGISRISLSGTAARATGILEHLPDLPCLEPGRITGRSLAMGGLSLVSLLLTLSAGERAVHLAASPEGPLVAITLSGGAPA